MGNGQACNREGRGQVGGDVEMTFDQCGVDQATAEHLTEECSHSGGTLDRLQLHCVGVGSFAQQQQAGDPVWRFARLHGHHDSAVAFQSGGDSRRRQFGTRLTQA